MKCVVGFVAIFVVFGTILGQRSPNYGRVGLLRNYGGIYAPTYSDRGVMYDDGRYDGTGQDFFGRGDYRNGMFGLRNFGFGGNTGQGNYGTVILVPASGGQRNNAQVTAEQVNNSNENNEQGNNRQENNAFLSNAQGTNGLGIVGQSRQENNAQGTTGLGIGGQVNNAQIEKGQGINDQGNNLNNNFGLEDNNNILNYYGQNVQPRIFGSSGLGISAALFAGLELGANLGNVLGFGINANQQLDINIMNREDIVRPCNLDDWQCIRKFFATNSQCSPSYGPIPDPLYMDQSTSYVPSLNLELLQTNMKVTGMGNTRIRDFYVNRVTGNLVFTIDIQNYNQSSPRSYMKYHRPGKESVIMSDFSIMALSSVSLTIVIPKVPNLRLDLAEIHADIQDESPQYSFGPGISNSTDSLVLSANAQLTANLTAVLRQSFFFQAQLLAAIYIQENICDFGIKLSSR